MPTKKQNRSSIFNFLRKRNPDLAEAIADLSMEGSLSSKRGGLTFIMPNDSLANRIIESTYSDNPEEAANLISACILSGYADKASNFPTETGNKLGLRVSLERVESGRVVLNGGQLEIQPSAGGLASEKIAIWDLVSGEPVLNGEKWDAKSKKTTTKRKRGGNVNGGDQTYAARQQLISRIQNAYVERVYNKSVGRSTGGADQAQRIVSSLVNRIYLNAEAENNINSPFTRAFSAIASVWDQDPQVMSAILLNPDPQLSSVLTPVYSKLHATGGLDAELSINAVNEYSNYSSPQYMSKLLNKLGVSNNIAAATDLLNQKRRTIAERFNQKGAVYDNDAIMNAYRDLYINNRVTHGGRSVEGVLPSTFIGGLAESEANTPAGQQNIVYNALARDLMRHTLALANSDLEAEVSPASVASLQREVAQNFNDARTFYAGNNARNNASLFVDVKGIKNIGDRSGYDALRLSFLNSTDFLHMPSTVSGGQEELSHVYGGFYNRQAVAENELANARGFDLSADYQKLLKLHA
jgi:hypothetical protein